MKQLKFSQSRIITLLLLAWLTVAAAHAESTVYFFSKEFANIECTLKVNGQEIGEFRGTVKKTIEPTSSVSDVMKMPYTVYHACKKKCSIIEEGKVIFSVNFKFTNGSTLSVSEYDTEIQLNLTEGSVHYIELTNKGRKDIQLKEISEKDAQKKLKDDKKYEWLPDYIQEPQQ